MRSKFFPGNPVKSRDSENVERVDNVDKRYGKVYGSIPSTHKTGKNLIFSQIGKIALC